jgi:hypothetical protein
MFHVKHREEETMKQIEVKVTSVPRAGRTVLLIECSACGPVAVDSRPDTGVMVGAVHLLNVHGLLGQVRA